MTTLKNKNLTLLLLFFCCRSILATESDAAPDNATSASIMLTPIILTLIIPEAEKNNAAMIKATQLSILKKLQSYKIDHVRQYTSLPMLAMSVDSDALVFLKNSDEIKTISIDGVSHTLSKQKMNDQNKNADNKKNTSFPCR